MSTIIGWDVGGAHLKAARAEDGRLVQVLTLPCPLWLGRDRLDAALAEAVAILGPADRHAATMTGELADIFASRAEGVVGITTTLAAAFGAERVALWAGTEGFVAAEEAGPLAGAIASVNWLATATLAARTIPDALVADIGSTTTDLVPIAAGAVAARGLSDAERLGCGELVYTGIARSFVMALADRVPFAGAWTPLACEYFASSADIHRILGELPEGADLLPAADGREKTVAASVARLARMVGRDAADASAGEWRALAAFLAEAQLRSVADAAALVLSRAALPEAAPVIGCGIGRHLAARLAARLGRPYRALFEDEAASAAAPAVAVALLAGAAASDLIP
ncbi:MAG TPA: hydantoinase/oxoprolinase family protein [Acetobacteraceae bacterium]|nr:hydantoinase/oxoprolinase family protein [Acetobacteraceae bacterium]